MTDCEIESKLTVAEYWASPEALDANGYGKYAEQVIPSNFTAIVAAHAALSYHLVSNGLPLRAVDFGCHQGDSTFRLASDIQKNISLMTEQRVHTDNLEVIGIDCIPQFVINAQSKFQGKKLKFQHISEVEALPAELIGTFSIATMFWVDQTIPDNDILSLNLKKCFDMLIPGGAIAIVRMAEESFNPSLNFAFYRHNKHMNPVVTLNDFRDPEPFINELLLPKRDSNGRILVNDNHSVKDKLRFIDFYRKSGALEKYLNRVGFHNVNKHPLARNTAIGNDSTSRIIMTEYLKAFELMSSIHPEMNNGKFDDGRIPNHEIILAYKPS